MKKSTQSGFTLVEFLIAATISLALIEGVYSLVYCSNILTAKCLALNSTNVESRNTMDQMQGMLQTAYTAPVPISGSGVALSSSLTLTGTANTLSMAPVYTGTTATITGTGAGIKFKRCVGGPYQTQIPTTGLLSTAASGTITLDNRALPLPPPPQKYDILAINSTAIISGTGYQVWATVNSVTGTSTSGNLVTYTVSLSGTMTDKSEKVLSTGTAIQYQTDNNNKAITCYTLLLRPTAFLFYTTVTTSATTTELRLLDPCTMTGSNVNVSANYTTLTRAVDITTTPRAQFAIVTLGGKTFVSSLLRIRYSDDDNYLANKQFDGFSTYMGLGTMIHLKSMP